MNLPTVKNGNFPGTYIVDGLTKAYEKLNLRKIAEENNLELLRSIDLLEEYYRIDDILLNKINVQRVFCHNDFRSQNILVSKHNSKIHLIDIEFASYGYRPNDLVTLLMEWGVKAHVYRIPEDNAIDYVCKIYLEEFDKIQPGYSTKKENSLKQLSKEIKVNVMRRCLFLISWFAEKDKSFPDAIPYDYKANLVSFQIRKFF